MLIVADRKLVDLLFDLDGEFDEAREHWRHLCGFGPRGKLVLVIDGARRHIDALGTALCRRCIGRRHRKAAVVEKAEVRCLNFEAGDVEGTRSDE